MHPDKPNPNVLKEAMDTIFKFESINCLQEQLVQLGKCPFCKSKLVLDFEVEDFCSSYHCPTCDKSFWL